MKLTPEKLIAFCAALSETCNVGKACAAVGIARMTAYEWRHNDPEFAERWDRAVKVGVTALEDEMHRRAYEGVPEPLTHKGEFSYEWAEERDANGNVVIDELTNTPRMVRVLGPDGKPKVKTIQRYSDTLAIFLAKAHNPEKYRENTKVELSGSLDMRHATDDDLDQELAALAALEATRTSAAPAEDDFSDLV